MERAPSAKKIVRAKGRAGSACHRIAFVRGARTVNSDQRTIRCFWQSQACPIHAMDFVFTKFFISRTASRIPTNIARETTECPILNSAKPNAATAATLR